MPRPQPSGTGCSASAALMCFLVRRQHRAHSAWFVNTVRQASVLQTRRKRLREVKVIYSR